MFHVLFRVLVSTSVNGVLTVGSADEAMQDLQFNSSVPGLLLALLTSVYVSVVLTCTPPLYLMPSIAPFMHVFVSNLRLLQY